MAAAASVPSLVELVAGANLLPTALVRALKSAARVRDVVAGTVLLRQRAVVVWAAIAISMAARLPECCR